MDEPSQDDAKPFRSAEAMENQSKTTVLDRSALKGYFDRGAAKAGKGARYSALAAFLPNNLGWLTAYLSYALTPKIAFPTYPSGASGPDAGIYDLSPPDGRALRIAIAGDWANGTRESWLVGQAIQKADPDLTIHLGDVYYVGDDTEIAVNCLGLNAHGHRGVRWPRGKRGGFALNGNHEMYAKGGPYFRLFLPTLGLDGHKQTASYFCLETPGWRIVALDTGFNSVGWPLLGVLPILSSIRFVAGDCRLEPALMDWLRDDVKLGADSKPTILLSHHNMISAFEAPAPSTPMEQIAPLMKGKELLWLWGHEHRMAIYDRFAAPGGFSFHARCLGHGGMPVLQAEPNPAAAPLAFWDQRVGRARGGARYGHNGFAMMTLEADKIGIDYFDMDGARVFAESFAPQGDGKLKQTIVDPGVLTDARR